MRRAHWSKPSCIVMMAAFVLLIAAIAWLASGYLVRTPSPGAVTRETPEYDTDTPSKTPSDGR
jgi:hypothetical protein